MLGAGGFLASCSTPQQKGATTASGTIVASGPLPPAAPREFRAARVSTVANIDWPSRQNLNAAQQQAEAIAILERARAMRLNAIVLQVRPSADAIYASKIEPWSEYLTGAQGQAPQPWYDPLKFWVTEAHARGLELHAWFNPYRARHDGARSPAAPNHITRSNPAAVKRYGKYMWMDPGEEAASKQTLDVILDVVRRYDIDGVHIDDYFYPYPIEATPNGAGNEAALEGKAGAKELDFPDTPAWERYLAKGGKLDRASWRRQNVNTLIEDMYQGIHREKSWVRFGISPFGLGRPDRRPPGIHGFSQYDKLYADAELWLQKGWLDYLSPQLYWPRAQPAQAYDVLLDYWISQNPQGRHIWPGLFTSRIGAATKEYQPQEILDQIGATRARPQAGGHVHFSMVALMQNRKGITDQLRNGSYATPALVPATPWLGNAKPGLPKVKATRAAKGIELTFAAGKANALYAVWARHGGEWTFEVVPASKVEWTLRDDARLGAPDAVFVGAVDRLGIEGDRVQVWGKA
ncbi:family 10 glycosylhydrolase [Massilia sp. Se16.2.3]|nr:family 10 glycosylhydrolase [Massilia sp. Se16.2.3]